MKISSSGKASWAYLNPAISYGEMTDNRDGQVYKTVKIGEQTWMAENLNYQRENSYCHDDSVSYCEKYGRYYTWASAIEACPSNWHLPTNAEFEILFSTVGGQAQASKVLKSTSGWIFNYNGSDDFGFSGIPAGLWDFNDRNRDMKYVVSDSAVSFFWTSSEKDSENAYYTRLNNDGDAANFGGDDFKNYGMSVRCLKGRLNNVQNSSSSTIAEMSSSSTTYVPPCKTSAEDNCEYGELKDERDGKTYKTVKIGNQWWMAENLNYDTANSFCYHDSIKYCAELGRLYTWKTALQACPKGSHLPTKTEFETLLEMVGGQSTAGKMLKATISWDNNEENNGNGLDAYSFSIIPAGLKGDGYAFKGSYANFWSSTEQSSEHAYYIDLWNYNDSISTEYFKKVFGRSVRCIKD